MSTNKRLQTEVSLTVIKCLCGDATFSRMFIKKIILLVIINNDPSLCVHTYVPYWPFSLRFSSFVVLLRRLSFSSEVSSESEVIDPCVAHRMYVE